MEYPGHVRKGVIVLDRRVKLEDGTEVTVRPLDQPDAKSGRKKKGKTLLERLAPIVGKAEGLPSDFARNHDHYLHGQPKK